MAGAVRAAAGPAAGRKAASVNSSGQDGGRQQGFVYAGLVPGGRRREVGGRRQGSPELGFRGLWGWRGEGTGERHLRGVCQPRRGSSS